MKHKTLKQMFFALICVIILIGIDQLSKYWVFSWLKVNGPVNIIDGVISFTYTQNPGAAWGIMKGSVILIVLPLIIAAIIAYIYYMLPDNKRMRPLNITLLFLLAGAIGNRIDRAVYGMVQDFIYFEPIDFPVFNIADCYIVVAAIVAAILIIFHYKDGEFKEYFHFSDKKEQNNNDSE